MATDWKELTIDTLYEDWSSMINNHDKSIGEMDYTGDTNVPDGFVQLSKANKRFEISSSASWVVPFDKWNMHVTNSDNAITLNGKNDSHYLQCPNFTGLLPAASIPNLSANKITSGKLHTKLIPDMPASKITSGTIPHARIDINSIVTDYKLRAVIDDLINARFGGSGTTLTVDKNK